jgi:site-specific DNA-methyltransferase (adenine-specific)
MNIGEQKLLVDVQIGDCKLMFGDCLERMKEIPDGSVDLVLTDPPYNIARKNNFHTMGRAGIDFGEWDKGFDLYSYIDQIPRILHKDGSVVIFNDWKNIGEIARHCESLGLVIKDMLRWEKANPMPRNRDRRYVTDYEVAFWCTNKNAKWTFNRNDPAYQRPEYRGSLTPQGERTGHTTQKPEWLMEQILSVHSKKNDTICDMFMGSGTTGVACLNTNRTFIGIEMDEGYFNIAVQRINQVKKAQYA